MESKERKCIACGEVLGERETYCGNCGTKAPDGAVDKEEAELEAITPNEENPPQWNYSWKLQDFFFERKRYWFSIYTLIWSNIIIQGFSLLKNAEKAELTDLITTYYHLALMLNIIVGVLFIAIGVFSFIIQYKLSNFQKNAPQYLYLQYIAMMLTCFLYIIFMEIIGSVPVGIFVIMLYEFIICAIALTMSVMYYEKRKDAFIN